jgi:hypothetical protein
MPDQKPSAESRLPVDSPGAAAVPADARRTFIPPRVETIGDLRTLTQDFGGTFG